MSREVEAVVLWEDVVHELFAVTNRFPKAQRFVISNRIVTVSLEIAEEMVFAQYAKKDKQADILESVNGKFTQLRLLLRIANRENFLSTGRLSTIVEKIDTVAKMVYGWKTRT